MTSGSHCWVLAWSVLSPGESTTNDQPNLVLTVLVTVLIQIPLCAGLLFGALHLFFYSTLRPIRKTYNKMPEEHWGHRRFSLTADGICLSGGQTEVRVGVDRITAVKQAEGAIFLCDAAGPVFMPKQDFTVEEVRRLLKIANQRCRRASPGWSGPLRAVSECRIQAQRQRGWPCPSGGSLWSRRALHAFRLWGRVCLNC